MPRSILLALLTILAACGNDSGIAPDGQPDSGNRPPPRIIAGGGIGDGPIDGVANLYVIDDATRMPIRGAAVRVGEIDGTTDETGLFVAEGVTGPQTVTATASGFRAEVWVGANGANLTMNLIAANAPSPESANLTGEITGFGTIAVAAGHAKVAVVSYSQLDDLGDPANELAQPNDQNVCIVVGPGPCTFTVTARTGRVTLLAAIYDRDLEGTPTVPEDDTSTLIGWAAQSGVTVVAGADQTAIDLTQIPAGMLQQVSVSFGSPPSGLPNLGAIVGIETADDGVVQLVPEFQTLTSSTVLAPTPEAFAGGSTYRLTALANDGATSNAAQSVVLRRAQTGTALAAGEWIAPPAIGSITRTTASWTPAAGATVHGLEYTQGATGVVNVTVFDASAEVTIPDLVTMPSGSLEVALTAIGAPGLDVTDFSLDADLEKLVMVGGRTTTVN